jgi:hypothetical protein
MLNVIYAKCFKYALYAECQHAECHYDECCCAEWRGATFDAQKSNDNVIFEVNFELQWVQLVGITSDKKLFN